MWSVDSFSFALCPRFSRVNKKKSVGRMVIVKYSSFLGISTGLLKIWAATYQIVLWGTEESVDTSGTL